MRAFAIAGFGLRKQLVARDAERFRHLPTMPDPRERMDLRPAGLRSPDINGVDDDRPFVWAYGK